MICFSSSQNTLAVGISFENFYFFTTFGIRWRSILMSIFGLTQIPGKGKRIGKVDNVNGVHRMDENWLRQYLVIVYETFASIQKSH